MRDAMRWLMLAGLLAAGAFWALQRPEAPARVASGTRAESAAAPSPAPPASPIAKSTRNSPASVAPATLGFFVDSGNTDASTEADAPSAASRETLLELAQALEADILADGEFHSRAALRAINDANFDDTLAALGAQAANDPRALALARDMAARLERHQQDPEVSPAPGRVVCGVRLCVTEQRVHDGRRPASAMRVGSGQGVPQPDGSMLHRNVYVAQRGVPHHVRPPEP